MPSPPTGTHMDTLEFYGTDVYAVHFGASATASQSIVTPVIGQYFDQDVIGSTGTILNNFYSSGQLWAMLIGIVLGYGFRSFSSYG
ncbi:MAG: hypothetical protein AB8B99_18505 [Phormidesmis sp.]